jgi:hypothetical protein
MQNFLADLQSDPSHAQSAAPSDPQRPQGTDIPVVQFLILFSVSDKETEPTKTTVCSTARLEKHVGFMFRAGGSTSV